MSFPNVREYRLFLEHSQQGLGNLCVLFWFKKHPVSQIGSGITFAKHKINLLDDAARVAYLQFKKLDETVKPEDSKDKTLCIIPKEVWYYHILLELDPEDVARFAQVCHKARELAYDDLLWKHLCYRTWSSPEFFHLNLDGEFNKMRLQAIRNVNLSPQIVNSVYKANIWRIIYIAFFKLERIPSVVHPTLSYFARRTSECFGTSKIVPFQTSKGSFVLKGIRMASCVEYVVYNYELKHWHRKSYKNIVPWDTKSVVSDLGLKLVRSRRSFGLLRRRGFFLYSDLGPRLPITPRYLPTLRFRAYKLGNKDLILCHDLYATHANYTDVYTMYEVLIGSTADSNGNGECSNEVREDQLQIFYASNLNDNDGSQDQIEQEQEQDSGSNMSVEG